MSKFISCCPVVAEEFMYLVPTEALSEGQVATEPVRRKVLWLQECESQVRMLHGRQILKYGSRFSDLDGYLTSVEKAWREAHHLTEHYELSEHSFQSIEVRVDIVRIPVLELEHLAAPVTWNLHQKSRQFDLVGDQWCRIVNATKPVGTQNPALPVRQEIVAESVLAWTSKNGRKDPAASLYEFKQHWDFTARPRKRTLSFENWDQVVSNAWR